MTRIFESSRDESPLILCVSIQQKAIPKLLSRRSAWQVHLGGAVPYCHSAQSACQVRQYRLSKRDAWTARMRVRSSRTIGLPSTALYLIHLRSSGSGSMLILPGERRAATRLSFPLAMMVTASMWFMSGYDKLRTPSSSDTTMMPIKNWTEAIKLSSELPVRPLTVSHVSLRTSIGGLQITICHLWVIASSVSTIKETRISA